MPSLNELCVKLIMILVKLQDENNNGQSVIEFVWKNMDSHLQWLELKWSSVAMVKYTIRPEVTVLFKLIKTQKKDNLFIVQPSSILEDPNMVKATVFTLKWQVLKYFSWKKMFLIHFPVPQ